MDAEATLVSGDRIRNLVESDRKKELRWPVAQDIQNEFRISDDQIQTLLKKVVMFMHRLNRPVFAGAIALEVGVSLRTVDLLLSVLRDASEVKRSTQETLKANGIDVEPDSVVYELVGRAQPWLAHD